MLSKVFSKCLLAEQKLMLDKRHYITGKYDKWESGKVLPKSEDIARLASFYEMSVDEFLGLTEEESEAIRQELIEDANKLPPDARKRVLDAMS
jgi:transcriptional regulator with XRE-family HTH domain